MPWRAEKKTHEEEQREPSRPALSAETLAQRYEQLRREILSHEIGSRLGLAVLLRQGMPGWIQVQSFLTSAEPIVARRHVGTVELCGGLTNELAQIVTDLILSRKELRP